MSCKLARGSKQACSQQTGSKLVQQEQTPGFVAHSKTPQQSM
jgi:hypothetical protein